MNHVQSHLSRHVPKSALTDAALLAMGARAWHDHGIICLRPEELSDDLDRQVFINAADKRFGKRSAQYQQEAINGTTRQTT